MSGLTGEPVALQNYLPALRLPYGLLGVVPRRFTNEVMEYSRVVYDVAGKRLATVESW